MDNSLNSVEKKNLMLLLVAMAMGNIFTLVSTGSALTGFIRDMGANNIIYGLVIAMPHLGSVFQPLASHLLSKGHCPLKIIKISGIIQRSVWVILGVVPFLFKNNLSYGLYTAILFLGISCMSGSFFILSQIVVFSQVIPQNIRGSFLTFRSRIGIIVASVFGILISLVLDKTAFSWNYLIAFVLAGVTGLGEIICVSNIIIIPKQKEKSKFEPKKIIKSILKNKSFLKYVRFWTCWNFVYTLTSPFVAVYCLQNLSLSFMEYNIFCVIIPNIVSISVLPFWGRRIDRNGCKPVMYVSFTVTALLSVLWLFAKPQNILIPSLFHIIGGAFWIMVEVTNTHMMISQIPDSNRESYTGIFSAVSTVFGHGLAAIFSGYILNGLNDLLNSQSTFWNSIPLDNFQLLFIVNTVIRLGVLFLLLPSINEKVDS